MEKKKRKTPAQTYSSKLMTGLLGPIKLCMEEPIEGSDPLQIYYRRSYLAFV